METTMKIGWRLVAKLGNDARGYPHVLADPHGWALRLGSNTHSDMKYFSNFPALLEGLIEHALRRDLGRNSEIATIQGLMKEVRSQLAEHRELARRADREIQFLVMLARSEHPQAI
jgi:hypothetical protein